MGLILLVGLVVKNGIMLLDFSEQLHAAGRAVRGGHRACGPGPPAADPTLPRGSHMSRMLCYGVSMLLSRIAFVVGLLAAASSTVTAQSPSGEPLTLQAALDRALAANPTIAAARLRGPIDIAGLAVARERLNPEASIEVPKRNTEGVVWLLSTAANSAASVRNASPWVKRRFAPVKQNRRGHRSGPQ